MHNSRFTIGLFIDALSGLGFFQASVWHGAVKAARLRNANLLVVAGGSILRSPINKYENTRNKIYDLINENSIDGIVFTGSTIGSYATKEEVMQFCSKYKSMPMVSVGGPLEDIPSVMVDNRTGFKNLISHLYEVHGLKRIAFIRGPEGSGDAAERMNVYNETMENLGIQVDPELIYVGDFVEPSGGDAVKFWLDEKKVDFQAIVASNDSMAIGAMRELMKRGIKIPGSIVVTGFDDTEEAATFTPPLTTVRQPVFEQSKRAMDLLLDFLEGKASMSWNEYLPTETVIRQSCGCSSEILHHFNTIKFVKSKTDYKASLRSERMMILANLTSIFGSGADSSKAKQMQNILDAFLSEILENNDGKFFSTLESIMDEVINEGEDVSIWLNVITSLRDSALPLIGNEDDYSRAECMFQKAHLHVSELEIRVIFIRKINSEKRSLNLSILAQALATTFEWKELEEIMLKELPRQNIPSFYISLYEDGDKGTDNCRIFAALDNNEKVTPNDNDVFYPSNKLIPQSLLPAQRRYTMVVAPLYFRDDNIGLILMEPGPMEGIVYETISAQISGSLKGRSLVTKSREAELSLEKRNSDINGVIMPMIDTIKQVAGISAEKMNFIREMAGKTQDSYQKIKETNDIIEKAALNIKNILQIISIINEISTTVNLVALNASIEATHAGEYGTGFSIIAREIKKLSDSTKKNSEEIGRTLKEVVKNVQDSVSIGKESLLSFEEQKNGVVTLTQSLEIISKNMDILSESSKKILDVMGL